MTFDDFMQDAVKRDAADPLAWTRAMFRIPDHLVYLDGNSLGALPEAALSKMQDRMAREWGRDLIASWNTAQWFTKPMTVGDRIARLIGAAPGQVAVTDSTSINLFKVLYAALSLRPGRRKIVSEDGNFPSDLYMAQGMRQMFPDLEIVQAKTPSQIEQALDGDTAVLTLTEVDFRTGRLHDMRSLTDKAHAAGALVIWDLAHSAGAIPVDLDGCNVDFAVGCTYKYLNAGPGGPAFLYVAERHQEAASQPLTGWIGHADPFAMSSAYVPATGIRKFLTGTPSILAFAPLEASLDIWEKADMATVRAKSLALADLFIAMVDALPKSYGLSLASPREGAHRGSQVSFRHPHAYRIMKALIADGVIGDFRAPDITRFGLTPLTLRYADIVEAVRRFDAIMREDRWRAFPDERGSAVT